MTTATVSLKKNQRYLRMNCDECSTVISYRQSYVRDGERKLHEFCADDAGKTEACPNCFMIGNHCDC